MQRVALLSPLAAKNKAAINRNIQYANACLLDSLRRDEAPFASHILYTAALDDNVPEERELGRTAGAAWETTADLYVAYVDLGVSDGMRASIETANSEGIPVEMRTIGWKQAPTRKRRSDAGVKRGPRGNATESDGA